MIRASLGRACRTISVVAIGLLAAAAPLRAEQAPLTAHLLTSRSTSGSFGFGFSGASAEECRAFAGRVRLSSIPISVTEVQPCSFAATPASALDAGEYCIDIKDFNGQIGLACLQVTGTQASLTGTGLKIENVGPDSWAEGGSCQPCINPSDGSACTRTLRQRSVRLVITNGPAELASAYTFAALPEVEGTPNTGLPSDKDFFVSNNSLTTPLVVNQSAGPARPCLRVYARPFSSSAATSLGVACLDAVLPSSAPRTFFADIPRCEPDYRARWCADNRADCESADASSLSGCREFAQTCQPALDAGVRAPLEAGSTQAPDAAPDSGSARAGTDTSATSKARETSGCSLGAKSEGSFISWLLIVALLAWSRDRRRQLTTQSRAESLVSVL